MRTIFSTRTVQVPEGVTVETKARVVTVTGPKGKLVRDFKHMSCDMEKVEGGIKVDIWFGSRKVMAALRTVCSHIENMITGVTKGFKYKMAEEDPDVPEVEQTMQGTSWKPPINVSYETLVLTDTTMN